MLSLNAVKMSLRTALLRTLIKRTKYNVACLSVREGHNHKQYSNEKWKFYKIGAATALLGSVLIQASLDKKDKNKNKTVEAGEKRPDLPTFRAEEVSKHDSKSSFWVTYKHGVYDVTEFLPSHPGGEQILNAAGLSIEPFWNVYGMHKTPDVYELLESYRIGNLHEDDMVDHSNDELWAKEPYRDKRLIVKTAKPFNAEIPPREQVEHFDTPNELFYVRQHMPVPELQAESHRVKVTVVGAVGAAGAGAGGDRTKCTVFRLQDLARFERRTVRAALMCAGNRRSEMHKQVKPVKGIDWKTGAISNAVWTGVYLRDVLIYCGVDVNNTEGKHVILQGADIDATGVNFSTSIPLSMAVHPASEVLLATHMNGVPLPPDHGYPLRAVVPGAPAVRSVKWLESIIVSEEESPSHWHQKDYRSFNPSTTWESADFSTAPPVYSLPVTSAICDPCDGDTVRVKDGSIELRGYAYSGGGAGIVRVDVSGDGGRSWHAARLTPEAAARAHTHYAWTLWTVTLPVDKGIDKMEIWAKATDTNFNTQPERFDHIWNIRGILSNAYHRITVKLQHS